MWFDRCGGLGSVPGGLTSWSPVRGWVLVPIGSQGDPSPPVRPASLPEISCGVNRNENTRHRLTGAGVWGGGGVWLDFVGVSLPESFLPLLTSLGGGHGVRPGPGGRTGLQIPIIQNHPLDIHHPGLGGGTEVEGVPPTR